MLPASSPTETFALTRQTLAWDRASLSKGMSRVLPRDAIF